MTFGKYKGQSVAEVLAQNPRYFSWILEQKVMPYPWKDIARAVIEGQSLAPYVMEKPLPDPVATDEGRTATLMPAENGRIIVRFAYNKFNPSDVTFKDELKKSVEGLTWEGEPYFRWTVGIAALPKLIAAFGGKKNVFAADDVKEMYRQEIERRRALDSIRTKRDSDIDIPTLVPLYPYQKVGVEFVDRAGGRALVADQMGLGKLQPLDAKVLTPTGWCRMGDITVGMSVVAVDGTPTTVTGVYPNGVVDIYRVNFTDGSSTECGDDHLWEVFTPDRRFRNAKGQVKPLSELRTSLTYANGNYRHFIPLVEPIQFTSDTPLPIDPYVLGIILGDGGISGKSSRVTTTDQEIFDACATEAYRLGLDFVSLDGHKECQFVRRGDSGPNAMTDRLRTLGLMGHKSDTKFIPELYLRASVNDRIALLQGLMDSDGWVDKPKRNGVHIGLATTSIALQDGIRELVQSLGGIARCNEKQPFYYDANRVRVPGKVVYTFSFALPSHIIPFRLSRKANNYRPRVKYPPTRAIKSVEYVGQKPAQCIRVDHPRRLYVTDDYIVTHNTATAIGYAVKHNLRTLVVCPKSVMIGWTREIQRFAGEDSCVWQGSTPLGDLNAKWHVINYDIVDKNLSILLAQKFDLLVCDEATYLKNHKAKRSKAIMGSWKERKTYPGIKTDHVILLTGTPVLNRPIEAFQLLRFLSKDRFGNVLAFMEKYGRAEEKPRNLDDLHERTKDLMIRRLKKDVRPDMPAKRRDDLEIELPPAAMKEYNKILDGIFRKWNTLGSPSAAQMPAIQKFLLPYKLERTFEFIDEMLASEESVLIFSQYRDPIFQIQKRYGADCGIIMGGMSSTERQKTVDDLRAGRKRVGAFTINAASMGIDGLQHKISTVLFLDRWWVPSVHEQAEDRLHRDGQKETVQVYYLTCKDTIDEDMAAVLTEKQETIDKVVDGQVAEQVKSKSFFKEFITRLRKRKSKEMKDLTDPTDDEVAEFDEFD